MKLTIKSGESVDNALKYLQEFLSARKEEYPILAGNLNIYITMKGFGNLICPENEKEYLLTREGVVDVEQNKVSASQKTALEGWETYVSVQLKKVRKAAEAVSLDEQYLESAEDKNRKPDAIEKRKRQLEKNRSELKEAEATAKLVQKLDTLVKEGKVKWRFLKSMDRKSPYNYEISPYIIFENVDGESWHFVSFESRYETPYGSLRKGLPYEKQ